MNGDSKIIYDAIAAMQKDIKSLIADVVSAKTAGDTRHEHNIRALENMSGDMTIVRTKIQELPCGKIQATIQANETNINRLWKFTVGGVLLLVVGAAVKIWLL